MDTMRPVWIVEATDTDGAWKPQEMHLDEADAQRALLLIAAANSGAHTGLWRYRCYRPETEQGLAPEVRYIEGAFPGWPHVRIPAIKSL